MGKILHVRNWKKEKGISLVELVISLTIIVIISIAGVSIAVYSSNSFKNNELKRHFVSELTSLSILYINSTNFVSTNFVGAVNSFYGDSVLSDEIDTDVYFDVNYKVIHSTSEFAYRLYFDFETDKLTLSSYTQSDKLIYSKEVSK